MTEAASEVDLLHRDFTQNPYLTYRGMREQGGVQRLVIKTLGAGLRAWLVTGYDDSRRLLADARLSKNPAAVGRAIEVHKVEESAGGGAISSDSMLFSDPPDHTRLRRVFGKAFTMRRVENLRPWIEEITETLLDGIGPGEEIDLVDRIAMSIPISVIGDLLGVPRAGHGDLREWNRLLTGVDTGPAEKYQAYTASLEYIKSLVADKRAHPGRDDDLITALLELDGDDVFTDSEILSTVFLVMNAGYETTANLISSGVHALLEHPDQQQLLRERPDLIPGAVEEFLRYEAPLNLSTLRCSAEPVTVGDTTIPAGELVFIALGSANRDPARFPEPDRLDVTRAATGHVAFGYGIHHCVGAPLARMEGEIVLGALLRKFPRWRATTPPADLAWRYSLQFRGLERLPVLLDRTA